jgi:hypothetical protein
LIIGESGLVSTGHVKRFTVWRENHGMRPVFASYFLELFEQGDFVKLIVAIGVLDPVKTSALVLLFVHHDIKRVEGVQEPPSMTDIEINFFEVFIVEGFS